MKINKLEIENVKRVKAVKIEPTANGLTVVGGKNGQGKTSVLDAIAWGLGGDRFRPSQEKREGSVTPPNLKITMNNGLVVERKGKNSDLKVTDPSGQKAGQQLLNSFVEELAINLPKFMNQSNKEKADTLLWIIGVGDQLFKLEEEENRIYSNRRSIGQIADQKKKYAEEQKYYPEAPKEIVSASQLIQQQQAILARNGENQRKRQNVNSIQHQFNNEKAEIERLENHLAQLKQNYEKTTQDLNYAHKEAVDLHDESTEELERNITQIDETNRLVRANMDKEKAEDDAKDYLKQYQELTGEIDKVRQQKRDLLANADLPIPELSVHEGELIYKGHKWDNMSGAEQLKVSTAIVRKLKPDCGFILIDKLEQMDEETLKEFGQWVEQEGLQAIATRVGSSGDCSILIEDGYVVGQEGIQLSNPQGEEIDPGPTWKAGEF
ncbi:AAA family ATPase [Alkalicoccobacillus gibsonii]|uniref:AAA family ATPase n=1 Tax=Alkalicoccobacillus gibsonii TaxID=79881 RepID=UPI003F7BBC1E